MKYKSGRFRGGRLHRSRDLLTARMRKAAVLFLAFSCCVCNAQVNENNDKVDQCSGSTGCFETCSLNCVTQSLGALGKTVTNMAEKVTHLETKLQKAENDVLELRSLIGGNTEQKLIILVFILNSDVLMVASASQAHLRWPFLQLSGILAVEILDHSPLLPHWSIRGSSPTLAIATIPQQVVFAGDRKGQR